MNKDAVTHFLKDFSTRPMIDDRQLPQQLLLHSSFICKVFPRVSHQFQTLSKMQEKSFLTSSDTQFVYQ